MAVFRVEKNSGYNPIYLQTCGIQFDSQESSETSGSGFSFMTAAGVMVGVLILLAAGLVIYNILKISVSKRMKGYGILRAIGSEKSQLYSIVSLQIIILCLIGIPIGTIVGFLSTKGIITMATGFLSPEIFMVQNTSELQNLISANSTGKVPFLAISAAITLFFTFVAAIPAASYAAKVPPTVAMSGQNIKVNRRNRKSKAIRNFEAYYARLNLKRNRGRTAITVLSLVMSIAVFIALQSFTTLLNAASGMEDNHLGDYCIVNETVGFSADDLNELSQNSAVSSVAAIQFLLYEPDDAGQISDVALGFTLQPGETFQVVGLNDDYWDYFMGSELSAEDLTLLKSGEECEKSLQNIFVGGCVLWHDNGGNRKCAWLYLHNFCKCRNFRPGSVRFHPRSADCRSHASIHRGLLAGNLYSAKKNRRNEYCGFH